MSLFASINANASSSVTLGFITLTHSNQQCMDTATRSGTPAVEYPRSVLWLPISSLNARANLRRAMIFPPRS